MRVSWLCFVVVAVALTEAALAPATTPDVTVDEIHRITWAVLHSKDSSDEAYIFDKVGRWMEDAGKKVAIVGQIIQAVGDTMTDLGRWMQGKTRPKELEHPFQIDSTYGFRKTWTKIRRGVEKATKDVGKAIATNKVAEVIVGAIVYRVDKFELSESEPTTETLTNFARSLQDLGKYLQNAGQKLGKLSPETMAEMKTLPFVKTAADAIVDDIAAEF